MLGREHEIALDLLRNHPGWSDPRVVKELEKRGLRASESSVRAWRTDAGLAPFTKNVQGYPAPRVPGVLLACGHIIHPEALVADLAVFPQMGHCVYCGRDSPTVR